MPLSIIDYLSLRSVTYYLLFIIAYRSQLILRFISFYYFYLLSFTRKLHLCSQLGVAELELEFQDGSSRTFMATVMQVLTFSFSVFISRFL